MELRYEILRSARRTIAIQLTPDGRVLVRCPKRMGKAEIGRFVESKRPWIEKHLSALSPGQPVFTAEELQALTVRAKEKIPRRAAYFAPLVGVDYGRVTIRAQHTRWGSCSARGNLNFNCLLMLAPEEVLDYVVVHELCHRKHMNHSASFWAEVARILPDYRTRRDWLKQHGGSLIRRLPETRSDP